MKVFLVEDNEADAFFFREAIRELELEVALTVVNHGDRAWAHLLEARQSSAYPDLVVLDINLPRMDGWEILKRVKATSGLREIPVVVVSSSDAENDIAKSYACGANAYLVKPMNYEQLRDAVHATVLFWRKVAIARPNP